MLAVVASIVGLLLWVIIRPLLRGVGWVISILSALAITYWLLTL